MGRALQVLSLGRVEYEDGLALQKAVGEARAKGERPDTLLLLEHPPVLTLGRGAKPANLLASPELLARRGVEVFETNRGGDITYHGPGQLVGYPILKLEAPRQDVRRYVRDLEEAVIRTLAEYGITATRIPKWTGVWVGDEALGTARKIAAIGVHLSRWQTSHGFALNVNTELSHFELIVPCGIREAGVTSMQAQLGRAVDVAEVEAKLARHFRDIFEAEPDTEETFLRTVSVAALRTGREGPEVLLLRRTPARGGFWQLVTGRVEPGESAAAAAARELREETGSAAPILPLEYEHAFTAGNASPLRLVRETAFAARWPDGADVALDASEHDAFDWVPLPQAIERLPFKGLRVAAARAEAALFPERRRA
jgi:lipoyl(octanoyl) transferase